MEQLYQACQIREARSAALSVPVTSITSWQSVQSQDRNLSQQYQAQASGTFTTVKQEIATSSGILSNEEIKPDLGRSLLESNFKQQEGSFQATLTEAELIMPAADNTETLNDYSQPSEIDMSQPTMSQQEMQKELEAEGITVSPNGACKVPGVRRPLRITPAVRSVYTMFFDQVQAPNSRRLPVPVCLLVCLRPISDIVCFSCLRFSHLLLSRSLYAWLNLNWLQLHSYLMNLIYGYTVNTENSFVTTADCSVLLRLVTPHTQSIK